MDIQVDSVFGILKMWFIVFMVVWVAAAVAGMVSMSMGAGKKMMKKMKHEMGEKGEGLKERFSSMGNGCCEETSELEVPCEETP